MTALRLRAAMLLVPLMLMTLTVALARPVAATEFAAEDSREIAADETIEGSLYWAGQTLVVEGTVTGDLIVAAGDIVINGRVDGSVMGAAQSIQVNGEVGGAMRVAGERVTINGAVAEEVVAFGNTVLVTDGATVGGPIAGAMAQLTIGGSVADDVKVAATTLAVTGTVDGSVDVEVEQLTVGGSATIAGDLTYRSRNEAQVADGAEIAGRVERLEPTTDATTAVTDNPFLNLLGLWLGLLVIGWLMLLVRPAHLVGVGTEIRERPLLSVGVGVLVWIGQIVAVISLLVLAILFAAVAAPLGGAFAAPIVVVILLIIIVALVAQVYVAGAIGQAIAGRVELSPYLAYAAGALIWAAVFVLASVVQGALAALLYFAAWFLALGGLTLHTINRRRAEAVVVEPAPATVAPAATAPPPG